MKIVHTEENANLGFVGFPDLVELVKLHEGFRSKPYTDTTGHWTIGYGLNLEEGITKEEAETLLTLRLVRYWAEILDFLPWAGKLPEKAKVALADMHYNLGINRLLTFKRMLAALKKHDFERAALEALDSRWARQVKTRSERIANLYREAGQ